MDTKAILSRLLRIGTIIFSIFVLIYGIVFISVDLTTTIPYETLADMQNGKLLQILICLPCIVVGVALLSLLTLYYVSRIKKLNILKHRVFAYFLLGFSIVKLFAFVAITILIKQMSLLLFAIIPTIGILIYAIYLILENKKLIGMNQEIGQNNIV